MTFDLIGLPPTPEELAAFLADDSPIAFERVVDRLLESPHYGDAGRGIGSILHATEKIRPILSSLENTPRDTATATG